MPPQGRKGTLVYRYITIDGLDSLEDFQTLSIDICIWIGKFWGALHRVSCAHVP